MWLGYVGLQKKRHMNNIVRAERNYPELVKMLRRQLALSQEDLARQLGVSFATVNRWESGHSKPSRLARAQLHGFCEKMIECGKLVLQDSQRP
jgi:putative transcriptional regulator